MKNMIFKRWKQMVSMSLAAAVTFTTVIPGMGDLSVQAAQQAVFDTETDSSTKAAGQDEKPYIVSADCAAYASSSDGGSTADKVTDGDTTTRWQARQDATGGDWIYVDLGKSTKITSVYLKWEAAAASKYEIQFSDDEMTWNTVVTEEDLGNDTEKTYDTPGTARYVRVNCLERKTDWGCSLFSLDVYGLDGLVKRPADYGTNLALNKKVEVSSVQKEWWMIKKDADGNNLRDEEGNEIYDQSNVLPENAVDGVKDNKAWHSVGGDAAKRKDDQWLTVDLGAEYEIGRVVTEWGDGARAYEIQVSDDNKNFTTVYQMLNGHAISENVPVYAKGRYVRIYCIASWDVNGFGIKELEVYQYREGEEKKSYTIEDIPGVTVVEVPDSAADYITDDVRFPMAKPPLDLAEDLQMPNKPVASNDWWQTLTIKSLGDGLVVMPYRIKYTKQGLSLIEVNDCWVKKGEERMGSGGSAKTNSKTDFYLIPEGMENSSIYDKVVDYSDYMVKAQFCDSNGAAMTNTFVKGSPYVYSEFGDTQDAVINSENITGIYDENGNTLLDKENETITTDHFGIEVTDADSKEGEASNGAVKDAKSWFAVCMPEGTQIRRVGNKIKIHFPEKNGYASIGAMTGREDLNYFYQHAYAFVRKTSVTYHFDEQTSKITTYYRATTEQMRDGFSDQTIQCLLPHQYKKSEAKVSDKYQYASSRGTLKAYEGNEFQTQDTFYGMVPQFTTPQNEEYDPELITKYLGQIEEGTRGYLSGDAYWQGKALHPLAQATLVADQSGNIEYRDIYLQRLRAIFEDWFTYSGEDDECYFYYDKNWGTLYYRFSEFGANRGICDHHFTYGYFLFAAAVLATYDDEFYDEYKEMLDLLVRDFASPYEDDPMFCRFRSYDLYEGHSWAGGYADNDDGNNQEAGGESLFGWVGMYLWAIRSGNKDFRDASIFGFTTELNDIEQYWFNYDKDNWPEDYKHHIVGQNYGATIFFGTFFDGNVVSIYGIHWLPVTEWITHYSMGENKAKLKDMYDYFLKEIDAQREIEANLPNGSPQLVKTPLTNWQHLFVPLKSQFDPDGALDDYWQVVNGQVKDGEGKTVTFDGNEQYNAYWFANAMKDLGTKSDKVYAIGGVSASVYEKEVDGKTVYSALVWNPTEDDMEVQFTDGAQIVGSAVIGSQSLVRCNPLEKDVKQVSTPEFSLSTDTYEDTQYLKITTKTEGADIHYTTDGSTPTVKSPVYTGRIAISTTATVKAVAMKQDCIDSQMQSVTLTIQGSGITTGKNIALGKNVTASSGQKSASNMVDGNAKTRWESQQTDGRFNDDDWAAVDLGKTYDVNKVKISWENAYASKYKIQVSTDNKNWTDVYTQDAGKGGFEECVFDPVTARYVRMQGVARGSDYGYSIYELGIYEARQVGTPQFGLESGSYDGNQLLSIGSGTKGVEIRYTTDGSEPDENSTLYIPRLTIWQNDVTIKAKAFKLGMKPSETAAASYQINGGVKPEDGDTYDPNDTYKPTPEKEPDEELLDGENGSSVDDPRLKNCLSYKKEVTVSSSENEGTASHVTDGDMNSGWSSGFAGMDDAARFDQWCYIDLGEKKKFNEVKIQWVTNNNQYKIQVSDDAQNWKDVCIHTAASTENKIDVCRFDPVEARYVKMQGIKVGEGWGYSLKEMMVYLSEEEQLLGSNIATGAYASVSSNPGDAEKVNDGRTDTEWRPADNGNQIVTLDLQRTFQVDKAVLNGAEGYTGNVYIWLSADGQNFKQAENLSEKGSGVFRFDAAEARYVKVEFAGNTDTLVIKELEVYTVGSADEAEVNITYYDAADAGASTAQKGAEAENLLQTTSESKWQAEASDTDVWSYIDLGNQKDVNVVTVSWEASYAEQYDIYLTNDIENWKDQKEDLAYQGEMGQTGEVTTVLDKPGKARYIVIQQTKPSSNAQAYGCCAYYIKAGNRDAIPVERVQAGPSALVLTAGERYTASLIVSPANADNTDVIWESSDESVATVNENGVIRGKAAGKTVITVTSAVDPTKTSAMEVSVTGPLKAGKVKAELTGDNEITLNWSAVANASGYEIYRAKSKTGKFEKIHTGLVTETQYIDSNVDKGTYYYKLKAIAPENDPIYKDSDFGAASSGVKVAYKLEKVDVTDITINNLEQLEKELTEGDKVTVKVTVSPDNATKKSVTYTSDNEAVATVSADGVITAVAEGTATITIQSVSNPEVKASVTITVAAKKPETAVTSITIANSKDLEKEMKAGDTASMQITVGPENASDKSVIYTSDNEAVATVSADGVITAVAEGKTTITVQSVSNSEVKASVTVTVQKKDAIPEPGTEKPGQNTKTPGQDTETPGQDTEDPQTQGSINKVTIQTAGAPYGCKTINLKKKGKINIRAVVQGTGVFSQAVTYQTSNRKVASVNAKGQIKAGNKTGTAVITVSSVQNPAKKATIKVKVSAKAVANKVLTLDKKVNLKKKGQTYQIRIKKYTKTSTDSVTYKVVSGGKYVKVDKYGVVTLKATAGKKKAAAKIQITYGKKKAVLNINIPKK